MNFRDAADWVGQHSYMLLGIGWGTAVVTGLAKYVVLPRMEPKRPVQHGTDYLASKAKADASMARLGLNGPKEP